MRAKLETLALAVVIVAGVVYLILWLILMSAVMFWAFGA